MKPAAPSPERYSNVAIWLHWAIALLIVCQLAGGFVMTRFLEGGSLGFTVYQAHKTVGLLIIGLTLGRIAWRLATPVPAMPAGMAGWEKGLAHLTHFGFYALLLAIPVSGWVMVSASTTGVPTYLFLLESLPFYHLPISGVARQAGDAHELLSWAALGLFLLHVAGALKHQLIDRKPSLVRMKPHDGTLYRGPRSSLALVIVVLVIVGFPALGVSLGILQRGAEAGEELAEATPAPSQNAEPAEAEGVADEGSSGSWLVNYEESDLVFSFSYTGNEVEGRFPEWEADIVFDPAAPSDGRIEVIIRTQGVSLSDSSLQGQAGGADGFDVASHPQARFLSDSIRAEGDGAFVAQGTLSLKGVEQEIVLPFRFEEADGVANAEGEVVLDRILFGIGTQNAPGEQWLSHEVRVRFSVSAVRDD